MPADPEPCAPSPQMADAAASHHSATTSSGVVGYRDLSGNLLLTVPEAASLLRVAVRTVWRLMADSRSGFPKRRRIRGRTLLIRDEVLAFVAKEAAR